MDVRRAYYPWVPDSKHLQDHAVERARALLLETLAGVRTKPRHALDVLWFYASERERLDVAEDVIGGSPEQVRRILRQAEEVLTTNPDMLANAHGRVPLLRAWTDVLLEASARIEREDRWGDLYAAEPGDDDFTAASAARAGTTWPSD